VRFLQKRYQNNQLSGSKAFSYLKVRVCLFLLFFWSLTQNAFAVINYSGEIAGNEVNDGTYDPTEITSVAAATATGGTIQYRWQYSTDNITWTNIGSSNSLTYDPGPISITTYYRRQTRNATTGSWEGTSNIVSKIVTNYIISTPASITAGNSINLAFTGSYSNWYINEVVNSDFSSNTGISTDLPGSRWWVGNSSTGSSGLGGNTFSGNGGAGNMFIVNSTNVTSEDVWYITVNVTAGNTYELEAIIRSVSSSGSLSVLQWYVNNSAYGTAVTTNNTWQAMDETYTATTTGNVTFSIRNSTSNTSTNRNDFALDDITIYEFTPITYLWTGPNGFTSTSLNPVIPNAQSLNSGLYTLTATRNGYSVSVSKNITVSSTPVVCLPPSVSLTGTNLTCFGSGNGSIAALGTLGNGGTGSISYQIFENIPGSSVSDLTGNANYPNSPNSSMLINTAEAPSNFLDNYGSRMIGYIVPRVTGTYYFWIASDDNSQLWLSTTSSAANRVQIASVTGWTNSQEWNKFTSQKSAAITLTAGQIYYIEILQKEGGGGDNLAVGWARPGDPTGAPIEVLPPSVLRPFIPSSLTTPVYLYSLNGGAFQSSPSFTGLSAGTYTVTLQDSYGCTATANVTLTEPPAFSSSATSNSPLCSGQDLDLTGGSVSSASYAWAGPNGFTSTSRTPSINNATASATGIYTLTVTRSGCSQTYTTSVTVTSSPSVSRTFTNNVCGFSNGSIIFTINDDPTQSQISLSWNGGGSYTTINDNVGTYTVSGLAEGSYSLRARWPSGNACTTTISTATLNDGNALQGLTMSPDPTTCAGSSVTISGSSTSGVSPYSYSWSGGGSSSTKTVSPTSTSNYTLTVTDNAGCTATGNVVVNVVSSPGVVINTPDSLICVNGASTITSAIDVAGTYTYQWQQSPNGTSGWTNIFGATGTTFSNSFLTTGSFYYRLIVTGSSGACTPGISNVFKIRVVSTPSAAVVAPDYITCIGTSDTLNASVSNGVGSITYQWQQSPNGTSGWADLSGQTASTYLPPVNTLGNYYYRVIAYMTGVGCSYAVSPSSTFTVHNPGSITLNPALAEVCLNATQTITPTVSGVSGAYSYQWQVSQDNTSFSNISGATGGTYNAYTDSTGLNYYRILVNFSSCGLQLTNSIGVQVNDIHTVNAWITNQPVCIGGSTQLQGDVQNATGTINYQWQSRTSVFASWTDVSGATSINYTPPTSVSGTIYYRLRVITSGNGCGTQYSPSITLNIVPQTSVTITPSSAVICINGVYYLNSAITNGVGPFTYQWQVSSTGVGGPFSNISGETSSSYLIPTGTTNTRYYRVVVSSAGNGCNPANSNVQTITVLPRPTVSANNTSSLGGTVNQCVGTLVKLNSSVTGSPTATGYTWSSGSGFTSSSQNTTALLATGSSGGIYTVTAMGSNGCTNTATTNVILNTNCAGYCGNIVDIRPLNPSGCSNTDGNITVDEFGGTNYESSMDGVTWFRGYKQYTGLGVGTYLIFLRDYTSKIICRTVNITIESKTTSFYTGENITGANGCFATNGAIQLLGVNSTDQVAWISLANRTYTPISSLTSNTITGLKPGTYYVRVIRGGIYCYSERIVTVPNTGTACPATAICTVSPTTPNLFVNGDFGSGSTLAGPVLGTNVTGYGYSLPSCNAPNDGFYSIANTTDCNGAAAGGNIFGTWIISDDHTPGDTGGYMMVVNASHNPDVVVEQTILNLCPNTQYNFTAYVRNLIDPAYYATHIYPNFSFLIDGVIQHITGNITNPNWNQVGFSFKTGPTVNQAIFSIRNNAPGGNGNDWLIDDITVNKCPLNIVLSGQTVACLGATNETITASVTDPNAEHDWYKWQESVDNGATWQDVTGILQGTYVGTTMNVTINLPTPIVSALSGKQYRIRMATTSATVDDAQCSVISQITQVIVPPVVVSVTPPQTICAGQSATLTATGSGGTAPYTYTWTNTAATGSPISVTPATTTVYTVTARDVDNCSATATTSVTVTPVPVASATAQTICSGNSFSVTPTSNIVGTTYTWTASLQSGTASGFSNQASAVSGPISQTLTNTSTTSAVVRYTVTPYNGICAGANFTFDVTVRPAIVITNPGPQTICSGTAFSRTPTSNIAGTTYTWSAAITTTPTSGTITGFSNNAVASAAPITQTLTNSGTTSGVVTYTVTPVANGCNGTPFTFAITVQPTIVITNPGPQTICSGASFSRTPTSNISGTTYTWTAAITTAPTSGTITGFSNNAVATSGPISQALTNSGTTNGVVTYTITPTANGCNGTPFTIAITVQPTMVITNPGNQTICSGASFSRTPTSNIAGTTYTWTAAITTAPTSGTITGFSDNAVASSPPISQTLTNNGITNGVVTYTVTPVTAGCTGTPFTFAITVQPTLTASLANPATICSGAAVAAVTPTANIAGTTYTWTAPTMSAGITGGAAQATGVAQFSTGALSNSGAANGTATYTITATNAAACNTVTFTVVVTIQPTLTASLANPATICSGAAVAAVTPTANIAGTTYTWTAPTMSAGITGGAAQATGVAQFSTGALSNSGAANGTATYTITATNAAACNTVTFTVVVTIYPVITMNPIANDTLCHTEVLPGITFSSSSGTSYSWTNNNISIGLAANGTGDLPSFTALNSGSSVVTASITVTPYINSCPGNNQTFNIIVNPVITMNPVTNDTVCSNGLYSGKIFTGTLATGYSWTNSNPSIGLSASGTGNITSFTAINNGVTPIIATITVTPLINNCPGNNETFTITVLPRLGANIDLDNIVICQTGTITLNANVSNQNGAVDYQWSNSQDGVNWSLIPSSNSSSLSINGATVDTVYYKVGVRASGIGCNYMDSDSSVVIVVPNLSVNVSLPSYTLCQGGVLQLDALTTNGTGTISYQWQLSTNNITFANIPGAIGDSLIVPTSSVGVTYYRIIATASGIGCGSSTSAVSTITVVPVLSVSVDIPNITVCEGASTTLTATPHDATGIITYQWQVSADSLNFVNISGATGTTVMVNTASADTLFYRIVATASGIGCGMDTSAVSRVIIVPNLSINVNVANVSVCQNSPLVLHGNPTNGTGTITYQWQQLVGVVYNNISGETSDSLVVSTAIPGLRAYRIVATASGNGCGTTNSDPALVTVFANPTITMTAGEFCTNSDIQLTASGGISYNWNGPSGYTSTNQNPLISNADSSLHNGKYYLTVTDNNGCVNNDSATVTILPLPAPPSLTGAQVCGPGSLILSGSNCSGTVTWFDQQFSGSSIGTGTNFATPILSESRNYFASCVSPKNCSSTYRNTIEARINAYPVTQILAVNPTCVGKQVLDNGMLILTRFRENEMYSFNQGATYNSGTANTPALIPANGIISSTVAGPSKLTPQAYTIRIISAEGCPIDQTVNITNVCLECEVPYCPPANVEKTK